MMGIRLAISDIKQMWASHILRLTVFGLMIVPLIYSFVYLWAIWNPSDYLYKYPLAVVNRDKGITQKALSINVGQQLTAKLLSQDKMDWQQVSLPEANKGIAKGKYFAAVIIPPNFTEQAYSAGTSHPERVRLIYKINEGNTVVGATITRRIMENVKTQLQKELSTRYLEVLFGMTLKEGQGLRTAADGAMQLADGMDDAYDGSAALTKGLNDSRKGMDKLGSGLFALNEGANQFENGTVQLNTLVKVLSAVSEQLVSSIDPRVDQIKGINSNIGLVVDSSNGIVTQLRNGLVKVSDIADSTYDLAQQTKSLNNSLVNGLEQSLTHQEQALTDAESSIYALGETYPELKKDTRYQQAISSIEQARVYQTNIANDRRAVETSLNTLGTKIETNASSAKQNEQQMEMNLTNLSTGLSGLNPTKLNDQIASDANSIKKVSKAIVDFSDDAKQLQDGSTKLVNGLNTFTAGFSQLRTGTERLAEGSQQLESGLERIDKGQHELANKLDEGANLAKDDGKTKERIAAIADPVEMVEDNIHPVSTNGTGFAPYFIAISLWVGSLLLFFAVDLKRVHVMPNTMFAYITNKYLAMASVVLFQAVISIFVLHNGLGITTVMPPIQLYGFALVIGLVFSAILFMLVVIFGEDIGRYIAIVLMMLQLASCSGSYPVQVEAKFFEFIAPYLPMTYAVHGLREIISLGDHVMGWTDALILIAYGVGSIILMYIFKHKSILQEIEEMGHPVVVQENSDNEPAIGW